MWGSLEPSMVVTMGGLAAFTPFIVVLLQWVGLTLVWLALFALIGWMPLRWWRLRRRPHSEWPDDSGYRPEPTDPSPFGGLSSRATGETAAHPEEEHLNTALKSGGVRAIIFGDSHR